MPRQLALLLLLALSLRLDAATHVWNGSVSDRFSDAGNWSGGSPAGDGAAELSFPAGVSRTALNNDLPNLTAGSISFGGAGYTLSGLPVRLAADAQITTSTSAGNELVLDLILGGGVYILHVAEGDLTFSGAISGSGPLTKRGLGISIFSGTRANTYSGATHVLEGNLRLMKPDNVPAVPGELFIGATGVNYENGSVSTIAREQIPDQTVVHVGVSANFNVGGVETIGGITLDTGAYVITGIPVGNFTSTDGKLILAGDISVLTPYSASSTLYGDVVIAGMRTLNMCHECDLRIDTLGEATPGSGLIIRGTGDIVVGYDAVEITGTYRGPTIIEGVRARINNPNTAVRMRGGRFSGNVASLVTEGGRLDLSGGVTTKGDLRLNPVTTVAGGITGELPRLKVGGVLDLNRAKFELVPSGSSDRVLGKSYILGAKQSAGPILGAFAGLPEGGVIGNIWRVSYQGGDGNDFTLTDAGRFPSRIRLDATPALVTQGDKVTLTATFDTLPMPRGETGTVTFYQGTTIVGTAPVTNGSASIEIVAPPHGSYLYRADFGGSAQYAPSTASDSIEVRPPTPVLTSVEPSTLPGGETVVVTVRGTNLLAGGRIVIDSTILPSEHISNEQVRFTLVTGRFEQDRTMELEYWQPSPGVVRSNRLSLVVRAKPEEKTRLTFEQRAIAGPVVPGGGAAWMSVASTVRNGRPVTEYRLGITPDSDNDGLARWEQTDDVPARGLWLMVDTRDGKILSGEPLGGTAPRPLPFPNAMFVRDPSGAYGYVMIPAGSLQTMLVRPGVGAWTYTGSDGSGRDLDTTFNGLWIFNVSSMQPVQGSPAAPAGVQPGDVFVAMDLGGQRWLGDRIDEHLRESDGPGSVRFAEPNPGVISVNEKDGAVTLKLIRTGGTDGTVSVDFTTADGTAAAGVHYAGTAGRVTFGPGEIVKTIEVPLIDDALYGGNTRFTVVLRNPAGTTISVGESRPVSITEDEPAPKLTASNITVDEGDEGTRTIAWTVSISGATRLPVTAFVSQREEPFGSPFNAGQIVFRPGGPTSQTIMVQYEANRIPEENRVIVLFAHDVKNAAVENLQGRITVVDDDFAELDVVDATLVEGKTGRVTVSISEGTWKPVTVKYTVISGSATAGSDFTAVSGTLRFDRTFSRGTIEIPVAADGAAEGVETFTVVLSDPVNAHIRRGTATVTITDAERPVITATPMVIWEGADGAFLFRLSTPTTTSVTFRVTTTPGSATSPSDFPAKTGELVTIFAGQTAGYLGFKMPLDSEVEGTETFTLTLSDASGATIGTPVVTALILDRNDAPLNPALAAVTITDASVTEGNAGESAAIFTVSLPAPAASALTVAWATADATATGGSDYDIVRSTVTFQPGETSKTIAVLVHGDTRHELDETFTVVLANGKVGTARIINDDPVAPRHRPSGS